MEKTTEQVYEMYWKDRVENEDGTIDMEKLKKTLHDFTILEKNASLVFEEFSDLSNPFTLASEVIRNVREKHMSKETAFIDLASEIEDGNVAMNFDDLAQYFDIDLATKLEVKQQLEQRGQVLTDPLANIEMNREEKTELISDLLIKFSDELRQRSNGKLLVGMDVEYADGLIKLDVGE